MKRNKKLTILALSVMLVMTLAATVISFSLANLDNKRSNGVDDQGIALADASASLTNIDYIIKGTAGDGETYKIVEIGSKATASGDFGSFTTDGRFKDYVINCHKTIAEAMADGKIEYRYYYSGAVTGENKEALAYIASADFVYVSAAAPYTIASGNDFGEDLYNLLHVTAIGDYKPFIIDKPESAGTSDEPEETGLTFNDVVKNYYAKMGYQYSTYYWDDAQIADANEFYQAAIGSGSNFVGINGSVRQKYWTTVKTAADAQDTAKMAEILVVTFQPKGSATKTMSGKLLTGATEYGNDLYALNADDTASAITVDTTTQTIFTIAGTPLQTKGYNPRYGITPDYVRATYITIDGLKNDADFDFTPYDMVIFEDECGGTNIDNDLYKRLVGVMYANAKIVYNSSLGSASTGTGSGSGTVDANSNFVELYEMVAVDGEPRYPNIMVTDAAELGIIMSSNSAETCKKIADIINNGSFRGIGGPGSTATTFTVLEIQPCYPIDEEIAAENGGYYTVPANVLNNKTREQLGITVVQNAEGEWVTDTSVAENLTTEYYAWELSEAKIAEMFNKDVNQVKVVHMSSEEFAGSKEAVLGNYDLVYIGGNTSALKDVTERNDFKVLYNGYNYNNAKNITNIPIYTMYANTGSMVIGTSDVEEGPVQGGTLRNAADGHSSADTFVTLNGNDFSYVAYTELNKYIDAGMPVVISDDVDNVYHDIMGTLEANNQSIYLQNSIDPNSYVYKFLEDCEASTKNNILWGFNPNKTEFVDNNGGKLGDTKTGTVEVFARAYQYDEAQGKYVLDANDKRISLGFVGKEDVIDLYNKSSKRPKLAVTSMPAVYNVYDPATKTKVTNGKPVLSFEFDITGVSSDYTVNLYADYDKNSIFAPGSMSTGAGEVIKSQTGGNSISIDLSTLTGKYDGNYTGPVYWKLEIVDNTTGAAVSTAKLAYIDSTGSDKKEINVLQILPDEKISGAYGENSWVSLIFCTECQRAYEILRRNPGTVESLYSGDSELHKISDDLLNNGCHNGIYTGRHEHRFGVVRYDSAIGTDDWYYNYADDISDMFDVNIDIMTSREFEAAAQSVNDALAVELATGYNGKALEDLTDTELEALKADLDIKLTEAQSAYKNYVTLDEVLAEKYDGAALETLTAAQHTELKASLTGDTKALALAEYNLKWFIYDIKDENPGTTAYTVLNNIYDTGMYSDFIMAIKSGNTYGAEWHYADYKTYYEAYAKALDTKLALKDTYDAANRLANYENWLLGCYQCVIIGPAESFCGDDIETEPALDVLEGYVAGGGNTLLFHDTLSKYSDAGAHKLTDVLLDYYGMDKYHAEVDTAAISGSKEVTTQVTDMRWGQNKGNEIYLTTSYGNYTLMNLNDFKNDYDKVTFRARANDGNNASVLSHQDIDGAADPGMVEFTVQLYTDGNWNTPYANGDFSIRFKGDTTVYSGKTDANGECTLQIPNYFVSEVTATYTANDVLYLPHKLKTGYSADKYLLPNLSTQDVTDDTRYFSWKAQMQTVWTNPISNRYYSLKYAYTDSLKLSDKGSSNDLMTPYKYATVDWHRVTSNGYQLVPAYASLGANKASKTNEGLVTMFPFSLSDELNIAPTHAQAYALDLNNDKVSVWYTIGGGDNNKVGSEIQAATPHDATDNYFIYSVGNLNYCGAGHCKVTGPQKDNNDERMLYINIICNSVTNTPTVDIKAYDYTSTDEAKTNNVVKKQGSEYIYKIDEEVTRPSFSFEYTLPTGVTAKNIKVYYDVDGLTGYDPNAKDVLIKEYTSKDAPQGKLIFVPKSSTDTTADDYINLELKPEYLTNGKYVYIVIQITDSKGKTTYQKIKVEYKDKLYNLT